MDGSEQLSTIIPMLKGVAAGIGADQLGSGTACTDFDVAGVLGHMTALASGFAPMFRGEEPMDGDPPQSDSSATDRFCGAMDELLAAVMSAGALERTIQTPGGPMPGAVFARLVAFDGLVHGWDLASATHQPWEPPEQLVSEVDAFARRAITAEMRVGGGFAAEQQPPAHADTMLRLVAFTGRRL